ncbi:MAG: hypothetical protein HY826_14605, partial [Actinobacteria bacterium]|nr:hypothetical protein [Actinomycetota bacterium]
LLAYDPARVANLRARLIIAAAELHAIRASDPAAAYALRAAAGIRNDVEMVWLPMLTRIIDSEALTGAVWRASGVIDGLQNSVIRTMVDDHGWSIQPDPLANDQSQVTAEEAAALATRLNEIDLSALVKDQRQLQWLAQRLHIIGRDPLLSARFLANLDCWPQLTRELARQHAQSFRFDYSSVVSPADITNTFEGLMSIWTHSLPKGALTIGSNANVESSLPAIDDADPYVQAMMLRALHPDAMTAAALSRQLLTSWLALKYNPAAPLTLDLGMTSGPNTADLLLPLLLDDPAACVWWMQVTANNPALLFETLDDPATAYRIALVGTDPANTTAAAAGVALSAILDYFGDDPYSRMGFDTDGHPGEYGIFLGDLVAPWLLQFTAANHDWPAPAKRKASLLGIALRDPEALRGLVADAERIRAGFTESLSAGSIDAAKQVGGLLNLLLQLAVNELVADERASTNESWNALWTVVGVAGAFLPGGPLVGIASGAALTLIRGELESYLEQPDPDGTRRTAERAMDVALTLAGGAAVSQLYSKWLHDGAVTAALPPPPGVDLADHESTWSCPSADYHQRFELWRQGLPGGPEGVLGHQAADLLAAFIAGSGAQANCAELAG